MSDIDIDVSSNHRANLPPLLIPDDEMSEQPSATAESEPYEDLEPEILCTPDQIKTFLRIGYKIGAWRTGYGDIWAVEEDELNEIATRIAPDINRVPMIAKAVAYGDQKSGWALLVYSYASRVLRSIRRRKEELAREEEESSETSTSTNGSVTPATRKQSGMDRTAQSRIIVP